MPISARNQENNVKTSTALALAGVHMVYPILIAPLFLMGCSGPLHAILLVAGFEAGRWILFVPFLKAKDT